ncbi:MAG TPA: PilZ domain-containing protein [Pyrinomonadaceae bacterium]|nr:PilZ domain-containing protein [Pyrinomonadaceae bacterium]
MAKKKKTKIQDSTIETEQTTDFHLQIEENADFAAPENRRDERRSLKIKAVIQLKESDDDRHKEIVEIIEVSKTGAGFTMSREASIGRLLSLVIDMPEELRAYDKFSDIYPVLGIVQTCYATTVEDQAVYRVGVAFCGKELPEGFKADPRQCYRLVGRRDDGLWQIAEAKTEFKRRRHSRFWRQLDVAVLLRDETTRTSEKIVVSTRDISASGLSVWGELNAEVGDRVKITSAEHDFFAMATVVNKVLNEKDPARTSFHFEFEGASFPVDQIHIAPSEGSAIPMDSSSAVHTTDDAVHDSGSGDVVRF